jgi:hypothetical protein
VRFRGDEEWKLGKEGQGGSEGTTEEGEKEVG